MVVSRFGIDFKNDRKSDPVDLGLIYDTSLIGALPEGAIRIYQFENDKNAWNCLPGCSVDTALRVAHVAKQIGDKPYGPYLAMIDTSVPRIVLLSDTASAVPPSVPVYDTIEITDNVVNSSVTLGYWRAPADGENGASVLRCDNLTDTIITMIHRDSIVSDGSVRAWLSITDGRFVSAVEVSRVVLRSASDGVLLDSCRWTPVVTTANLTDPSAEAALRDLSPGNPWTYDSLQFRVFRWCDTTDAADAAAVSGLYDRWIEYGPASRNLFSFVPGRVLWIKSRGDRQLKSLGSGTTVSLKEPYGIELKAKQFTDIALPFNFDIRIGDILESTSFEERVTDQLYIYKWEIDSLLGKAVTRPKYLALLNGLDSKDSLLSYRLANDGIGTYSVYNSGPDDVLLRIPAIPESFSTFGTGITKRRKEDGWSVAVEARTGNGATAPLYCGFKTGHGKAFFPVTPSFGRQRVLVCDEEHGTLHGGSVVYGRAESGCVFPLVFVNGEARKTVFSYKAEAISPLPDGYVLGMYDPAKNRIDSLSLPKRLSVEANASAYRWMLVGDSLFMASWTGRMRAPFAFFTVFPNPCRGIMNIRFNLPYDDINEVRIEVFDQIGRRIWKNVISGSALHRGPNSILWNPGADGFHPGTGTYIVRLSGVKLTGKRFATMQRKILFMP